MTLVRTSMIIHFFFFYIFKYIVFMIMSLSENWRHTNLTLIIPFKSQIKLKVLAGVTPLFRFCIVLSHNLPRRKEFSKVWCIGTFSVFSFDLLLFLQSLTVTATSPEPLALMVICLLDGSCWWTKIIMHTDKIYQMMLINIRITYRGFILNQVHPQQYDLLCEIKATPCDINGHVYLIVQYTS